MEQKGMVLRYRAPAPCFGEGVRYWSGDVAWERYSLPLGNGFFGASLFGRTETERIQISEPTLANPYYTPKTLPRQGCSAAGLNSFADLYLDIGHESATDYIRTLSLEDAIARVSYTCGGVSFYREAFTSHPDRALVLHLTASQSGAISFTLRAEIPFLGSYTVEPGDGLAKDGRLTLFQDGIAIEGTMAYYGIQYFGLVKVATVGGRCFSSEYGIVVSGADEATLIFSCDTNYTLDASVFLERAHEKKLAGRSVDQEEVTSRVNSLLCQPYSELKKRHTEDYRTLYSRVSLELGDADMRDTDALVAGYALGESSSYLEALLFQYGRYLLISSSRGRLPSHLQGIWNAYCDSPWSAGYWHNINVQMNYWPASPSDLGECFLPYVQYAKAYMHAARQNADRFIQEGYPEKYSGEGKNGWIIGTGAWPYQISGVEKISHSGPGTGAFTSLLFWDHYDYTRDRAFLKEFAYPALREMSLFFTKILVRVGDKYLIQDSASPENEHNGVYYHTVGCAFDQQMVYENMKRTIEAAELLGEEDAFLDSLRGILPHLDPVQIGDDGQVKEYREETGYSSIGEPHHRHISHLVGLYPGTLINDATPEWLAGAEITLSRRGDNSTCWAVAHRLLLWARVRSAAKCRDLIQSFVSKNLLNNLWCNHPPFQIDGNLGYVAGVCEMLLQSHGGYLHLLPSLPAAWNSGSFSGLVARGNFSVDCRWERGRILFASVLSRAGGPLRIKLPNDLAPKGQEGENGIYTFSTRVGERMDFQI